MTFYVNIILLLNSLVNLRKTGLRGHIGYDIGFTNTPETSSESKIEENESIMIASNRMEGGNLASQPELWPLILDPGLKTWTAASQPGPWPLNLHPGKHGIYYLESHD
jgi:hypothetical protein